MQGVGGLLEPPPGEDRVKGKIRKAKSLGRSDCLKFSLAFSKKHSAWSNDLQLLLWIQDSTFLRVTMTQLSYQVILGRLASMQIWSKGVMGHAVLFLFQASCSNVPTVLRTQPSLGGSEWPCTRPHPRTPWHPCLLLSWMKNSGIPLTAQRSSSSSNFLPLQFN